MDVYSKSDNLGYIIRDKKNRELIRIDFIKNKVFVSRFEDTPLVVKELIADVYCQLVNNDDRDKLMEFLNFTSNDNKFCS